MLLEIDGLRASRAGIEVLDDVRMHLDRSEIYGLLGPNGAGKSTTIAVILGLLARQGGEVAVFGVDPATVGPAVRTRLGVLPERNGFYEWMTAQAYLEFYAELHGIELGPEGCTWHLERVGLGTHGQERIARFSRGMRQRLGLARALLGEPELLILDEPTNGLDPRGRREFHDLLLNLARTRAVAVLLCTHLLDDVERLCRRAGIIVDGRTVAEGTLTELARSAAGRRRFRLHLASGAETELPGVPGIAVVGRADGWCEVELPDAARAELAWAELYARGWPIVEIHTDEKGLEQAYLALTERSVP
jgi:ABC-2 type transport system ATP-binding protein